MLGRVLHRVLEEDLLRFQILHDSRELHLGHLDVRGDPAPAVDDPPHRRLVLRLRLSGSAGLGVDLRERAVLELRVLLDAPPARCVVLRRRELELRPVGLARERDGGLHQALPERARSDDQTQIQVL